MCEKELEYKYRSLVQGTTVLESSLHQNISEHINSEIGIGTITSVGTAKDWLRHSFLRQRIEKNPTHYQMGKVDGQTWEDRLDDIVLQSIRQLDANQLICMKGEAADAELSVTEYGEIMSKVRFLLSLIAIWWKSWRVVLYSSNNGAPFCLI